MTKALHEQPARSQGRTVNAKQEFLDFDDGLVSLLERTSNECDTLKLPALVGRSFLTACSGERLAFATVVHEPVSVA